MVLLQTRTLWWSKLTGPPPKESLDSRLGWTQIVKKMCTYHYSLKGPVGSIMYAHSLMLIILTFSGLMKSLLLSFTHTEPWQFQIWRCAHVFFLCLGYWKLFIKDWMKLMQRPFNHSEIIIQSPSQIWQCFEPEGSRDLGTSTNKEKKKEEDFWIGHTDMLEYIPPQPLISFFKHTFICIIPSSCYWFKGPWKMFSPHTMTLRLLKAAKSTIKGPLLYLPTKRDKSIRRGFPHSPVALFMNVLPRA